jgi:uncharacterized protein (DUF488 family)
MPTAIYTIGHSTRTLDEFVEILKAHAITQLVDIRTIPKSRHNPQFNGDNLGRNLPQRGIAYLHLPALGGLRKPRKDSVNTGWRNASFRGFADYMQTRAFVSAVRGLMQLGRSQRVVIMCAEGNPFRCHRSLVADALTVRKVHVFHISSKTAARPHTLTKFARIDGTRITYP